MEQDKAKQQEQPLPQQADPNLTVDRPGAQVADYGNTTGGSANEELEQKHGMQSNRQGNSSIPPDEEDTAGNS